MVNNRSQSNNFLSVHFCCADQNRKITISKEPSQVINLVRDEISLKYTTKPHSIQRLVKQMI